VAARGDRKRAFWCAVVGAGLIAGGILSFLGARVQYDDRIVERARIEADAARAGRAAPPGPDVTLLRKERGIIPWLLHLLTFGGAVLVSIAIAELRGWRLFDPIAEQPPPPKLS
jgi:hypothetical protein